MKYQVKYTSSFKKGYKRMKKRGCNMKLLDDVVAVLSAGLPLDVRYRDHILLGTFAGFHECHIRPDWLRIYLVEDDVLTLTFTETGTHSDLLDM